MFLFRLNYENRPTIYNFKTCINIKFLLISNKS
jgi:hypothetical protein